MGVMDLLKEHILDAPLSVTFNVQIRKEIFIRSGFNHFKSCWTYLSCNS